MDRPSTDSGVFDLAAAGAGVEVVGSGGLHGVAAGGQSEVLGRALAGGDPGTLVAVLVALDVRPPAGRELVADRLAVLVTLHDRHAIGSTARPGVDEVCATAGPGVRDVGLVGEGERAVGGGGRAARQRGIAGVVVPGAELASRGVEAVWVSAGR